MWEASVAATSSGVPVATMRPPLAALGAEVDHPVGGLDHVEVVLDDDDGVALLDQAVEHLEQLLDVREVQAGRRLVEDVERAAGGAWTARWRASPAGPRRPTASSPAGPRRM